MAEFTLEEAYGKQKPPPKPAINPALVNALVPPAAAPAAVPAVLPNANLSPKDQKAFDLAEANRRAAEKVKIAEEKRAETRKLKEEEAKEANPMGSITEGERKASTLLTRMQSSSKQLQDVLTKYPDAAKPEYLSSFVQGFSEPAANLIRSTPRQQIETAQKDIVDAFLTASTGATYTPIQFKEFKEFLFPQIGDDAPTLKDKESRLKTAIEAVRLQAGRAAKLVPEVKAGNKPPTGAPPDAKQAKDGNWYSPDPKRPGKYLQWGD
tara:strand:- start:929 stop:1726 length:798 start_codon:yes stop_codon:yes gene_type:complete